MKLTNGINRFFDRICHEIRIIPLKKLLISGGVFLGLGILSWLIGGKIDKVSVFYLFPRSAIPIGFMFILWGIFFFIYGITFGGVILGCEKYKRHRALKISIYMLLSYIFVFCLYPIFFGAMSFFGAFIVILLAEAFCLLAILSSFKLYSLWTLSLSFWFLWLTYNGYVSLAFTFIN